jgi:hypothetical protein
MGARLRAVLIGTLPMVWGCSVSAGAPGSGAGGELVGRAERIDHVAPQSQACSEDCTADIPHECSRSLIANTDEVRSIVMAGARVGKL